MLLPQAVAALAAELPRLRAALDRQVRPEAVGPVPEDLTATLRRLAECIDRLERLAEPRRDKIRWDWDDVEALTGYDRRWMQREVAAGRMPRADLRAGRRAGWKPNTITTWLDSLAASQGRRRS
jgi:hypothetical protein